MQVDLDKSWTIPEKTQYSKAGWTPFAGMPVKGCLHKVVLRGEVAFVDGKLLVKPGFGQDVRIWSMNNLPMFKPPPIIKRNLTATFSGGFEEEVQKDTLTTGKIPNLQQRRYPTSHNKFCQLICKAQIFFVLICCYCIKQ